MIPDEFCRFAIKWQATYLVDIEKCLCRDMRTPVKSDRKTFPSRAEAELGKAEWAKAIGELQACDPHLKIVRLVPSRKKWVALAAELYVGVFEAVRGLRDNGLMSTRDARAKLTEAYIVLLEAIRAKNCKAPGPAAGGDVPLKG